MNCNTKFLLFTLTYYTMERQCAIANVIIHKYLHIFNITLLIIMQIISRSFCSLIHRKWCRGEEFYVNFCRFQVVSLYRECLAITSLIKTRVCQTTRWVPRLLDSGGTYLTTIVPAVVREVIGWSGTRLLSPEYVVGQQDSLNYRQCLPEHRS